MNMNKQGILLILLILSFIVNLIPERVSILFAGAPTQKINLKAYVLAISNDRWLSAYTLLSQANLKPIRLIPIPLDAPVINLDGGFGKQRKENEKFRKYHNGKLSSIRFWRQIAYDSSLDEVNGYSLIFEDDIALHPSINITDVQSIIEHTANLSRDAGIFFLGLCAPECRSSVERKQIKYSECVGPCLHAYGVFKWRAEWLYEELAAVIGDSFRNHVYFHALDRYTAHGLPLLLGDGPWPYLAGSDLASEIPDHKGIFFQDRTTFPSEASPSSN